jgi:hypothetical protein
MEAKVQTTIEPEHGSAEASLPPTESERGLIWKRVAYVVAFLAVVFVGDRVLGHLLDGVSLRSQMRLSRLYRGGESPEILVIGNSRGVHSFHAPSMQQALGKSVFNLSLNGISTEVAEALIGDYLDRNAPPRLLVIEVSNAHADHLSLSNLKLFYGHSPRLQKLFAREHPQAAIGLDLFHLYRFNCENFLRAAYFQKRSDQDWIFYSTVPHELLEQVKHAGPQPYSNEDFQAQNLPALKRMIAMAKEKNIAVRLVIAPFLTEYREQLSDWREFIDSLRNYAGSDLAIWDYSNSLSDPECFADRLHTNYYGAASFLHQLKRDGFFDTRIARPDSFLSTASDK